MLTDIQSTVLTAVSRLCTAESGFYTGEIAVFVGRQPGRESNQQHSALVLRTLKELEQAGLVSRLDDRKPVVWCKPA